MDAMTQGANEAIANSRKAAIWAVDALRAINRQGGFPDMIVGKRCKVREFQDSGRTLVLPLDYEENMYACLNETGGATIMLASEY